MLKKKTFVKLAFATMLVNAGISILPASLSTTHPSQVQASATSVAARELGIDVASYQSADLTAHAKAGSQFAIVKVSEGTSYRNPKAAAQIKSAITNDMTPMGYHFATFSSNASSAKSEAKYAVSSAKALGLPKGSYLACDYETGSGNILLMVRMLLLKPFWLLWMKLRQLDINLFFMLVLLYYKIILIHLLLSKNILILYG